MALAGAITAIAAALYIVAPQLAPREKLGAELDRIAVAQGVYYETYEREQGTVRDPDDEVVYPPEKGLIVMVHAKLFGYENRSYSMNITAYDAATHERLAPVEHAGDFSGSCENKSPQANEDGVAWRCWMIAPPAGIQYFLRAELLDSGLTSDIKPGPIVGSRALLDFRDSAVFTSQGP